MKNSTRRTALRRLIVMCIVGFLAVGASRDGRVVSFLRSNLIRLRDYANRQTRESIARSTRNTSAPAQPSRVSNLRATPIPYESEYRDFLASLNLRNFTTAEIIRPHRNLRNGVRNSIPPRDLWAGMADTLRVADELRNRLGVRVKILSAYRSTAYNSAIKGASRSQHIQNRALDLKFDCSSDLAFKAAEQMRNEGLFRGGIGWYPSFIHVDTRGRNATWGRG